MRQAERTLKKLYLAGTGAVMPEDAVRRHLRLSRNILCADGTRYNLERFRNIHVVGAGKAAPGMARAVEDILGSRITAGVVVTEYGLPCRTERIEVFYGRHPVPDRGGLKGAKRVLSLAEGAKGDDLVICLISGGASALLPAPVDGITLRDKQLVTELLVRSGAHIGEINTVRKHLSRIKGGGLARACYPATVLTLIISDVVGGSASTIGSGPTSPDATTVDEAIGILKGYSLTEMLPERVLEVLRARTHETPKPGDPVFRKTKNFIIADNITALKEVKRAARAMGYRAVIITSLLTGDVGDAAGFIASVIKEARLSGNPSKPPCCILFGGETTVRVRGRGRGGRCQELALLLAEKITSIGGVAVLCAGTDGIDGITPAAGAFVYGTTLKRAQRLGLDPRRFLLKNDSYNFFRPLGDLFITGPTGTNVADMVICLVE